MVLVEDDARLGTLIKAYLDGHGVETRLVLRGDEALAAVLQLRPDVVILDVMLPGIDGFEVCHRIRAHLDVPILMLTARGHEGDRVRGLESGADDYVQKPFSSPELLARVRALGRRYRGLLGPRTAPIRFAWLELDPVRRSVSVEGTALHLTTAEFDILRALAERPGQVLTREQLLELARGSADESFDRSIDIHISRLRQKLGDDPRQPARIKTVRGAGYLLDERG